MSDEFDYHIKVPMSREEFNRLSGIADERGLEIEDLVLESVHKVRMDEPTKIGEPEDCRYIVFRGFPENFGREYHQAKDYARKQAESVREPFTVMVVHRLSPESAVTAVYHGVQVHAIDKARELCEPTE